MRKKTPQTPPSTCWSLIVVDNASIRERAVNSYRMLQRELRLKNERIRTHQEKDFPSFERWFEVEFEREVKNSSEQIAALRELEATITKVEHIAYHMDMRKRDAYHLLDEVILKGEEEAFWEELRNLGDEAHRNDYEPEPEDFTHESESQQASDNFSQSDTGAPKKTDRHSKTIYRQLVRLLHPDTHENVSEKERKIWFEVQDAYAAGDTYRLEQLLQSLTQGNKPSFDLAQLSIGELLDMARQIEDRMLMLSLELREAKQTHAWNFRTLVVNKRRVSSLRAKISNEFQATFHDIAGQRKFYLKRIADWQRVHTPKKKPKSNPRGQRQRSSY